MSAKSVGNGVNSAIAAVLEAERMSAQKKDLTDFFAAVTEAAKQGIDFQTIEKALRAAQRHTFLIATRPENFYNQKVPCRFPGDVAERKYCIYAECGPWEKVLRAIQHGSLNYDDNFAKLKETGFAIQPENVSLQQVAKEPNKFKMIDNS